MNIAKMMQQAKAMQDKMQTLDAEMAHIVVEGSSGGGMVKVAMTCKGVVQSINIDASVLNPSDKEMVEDLVLAAMNDGRAKGDARVAEETQKMMASLGLPAGVKLPF